jgi:hypothetical protein
MPADTALAPLADAPAVVRPVAAIGEVIDAWNAFVEVKNQLLTQEGTDYLPIQGKPRILKAGWRKVAAAFGISTEIRHEARRDLEAGAFVYEFVVRALAPNGRFAEAAGSCASDERAFSHKQADVRAQAQTRATSRAISDLVGGGEVSAEELLGAPIICGESGCGAHLRGVRRKDGTTWDADQLAVAGEVKFGKPLCGAHFAEHVQAEQEVGTLDDEAWAAGSALTR